MNALKPAVAIAAALFAGSGLAGTVKLTGFRFAGPMDANDECVPAHPDAFAVGEIKGLLNGSRLRDLLHGVDPRYWYLLYSDFRVVAGVTQWGAPKATDLNKLFTQNYASVTERSTSSAMQLAVWEIIHETSGTYDVSTGNVPFSTGAAALSTANTWLTILAAMSGPLRT